MRNEYPRPDFRRKQFVSLDETWGFDFDDEDKGHKDRWYAGHVFSKKIEVPFCFESNLSGIQDTSFHDRVWYYKDIHLSALKKDEEVLLHFEGVDYYAEVYFNGAYIGSHYGMNAGFVVDATPYAREGLNEIVVYVKDDGRDRSLPRGKQDWEEKSHGIWYTRTTGIYKPVWYEIVNKNRIKNFYLTTKIKPAVVSLELETTEAGSSLEIEVSNHQSKEVFTFPVKEEQDKYSFTLSDSFVNHRFWSPEDPFLFDIKLSLVDKDGRVTDTVESYFGLREVTTKDGLVLLNGEPIYQKLVLNQGYYPDGILTAPDIKTMENDIDNMMAMGFNGCRVHQKTEEPYFLYLCDKKGFIVWQECASNYGFGNKNQRRFANEWIEIVKNNYNHPSILVYTPFNESWGVEGIPNRKEIQDYNVSIYHLIHSLDESRLVISNDGWEQCETDLITIHNYDHGQEDEKEKYQAFERNLATRENITSFNMLHRPILIDGYPDKGQPILLTEFGGVAFDKDTKENGWGYTTCKDEDDYVKELKRIYKPIEESSCIVGICFTQYTDVEQERNGLLTYDRKFKVDPSIMKEINDSLGYSNTQPYCRGETICQSKRKR